MQNGGNVGQVLERLIKGVKAIETKVPFSRDDRLGWLTFCPSNLVCFEFVVTYFVFSLRERPFAHLFISDCQRLVPSQSSRSEFYVCK